jgi:hypothetical protein
MLLVKIIDLATDIDKPLSVLLRLCVVLGDELKNESLKTWANDELNGYSELDKLPAYRIVIAGAKGHFNTGYAFPMVTRPIAAGALKKPHREFAETVRLLEPVSAYENILRSSSDRNSLVYQWSATLVVLYQETLIDGHVLIDAWQEVPFSVIAGVLDTIRTRVLNVALAIKREIGESDADLKQIEHNSEQADKVNHIVINHIYGGTVNVGHQQTISTQNIAVGNWQELTKALLAVGIQEHDIGELSRAIDHDGKKLGSQVKGWIARNAANVWDKGLQVGTSVGTTILLDYLKRHLGM